MSDVSKLKIHHNRDVHCVFILGLLAQMQILKACRDLVVFFKSNSFMLFYRERGPKTKISNTFFLIFFACISEKYNKGPFSEQKKLFLKID
jgi:ubiquitin C-terminal hydrolase